MPYNIDLQGFAGFSWRLFVLAALATLLPVFMLY
jgi:hypothetical protein